MYTHNPKRRMIGISECLRRCFGLRPFDITHKQPKKSLPEAAHYNEIVHRRYWYLVIIPILAVFQNRMQGGLLPDRPIRETIGKPQYWSRIKVLRGAFTGLEAPEKKGLSLFEGAFLSDSFYLSHLSNSPYEMANRSTLPFTVGTTSNYWWQLNEGHETLSLSPRSRQLGRIDATPREQFCRRERAVVADIALLGVGSEGAALKWTTGTNFTIYIDGVQYLGQVGLTHDKKFVNTVIYTNAANGEGRTIEYYRADDASSASLQSFAYLDYHDGIPYRYVTNRFDSVTPAPVDSNINFRPSSFRSAPFPLHMLIVWSNSTRFFLERDLKMVELREDGLASDDHPDDHSTSGLLAMVAVPLSPAIFLLVRPRDQKNIKDSGHKEKTLC